MKTVRAKLVRQMTKLMIWRTCLTVYTTKASCLTINWKCSKDLTKRVPHQLAVTVGPEILASIIHIMSWAQSMGALPSVLIGWATKGPIDIHIIIGQAGPPDWVQSLILLLNFKNRFWKNG